MRVILTCCFIGSFLLAIATGSINFNENSLISDDDTSKIANFSANEYDCRKISPVHLNHFDSLLTAIESGRLSLLEEEFIHFKNCSEVYLISFHWKSLEALLMDYPFEGCFLRFQDPDYREQAAALEVRECIFEYLCFTAELTAKLNVASQHTNIILALLRLVVKQRRFPEMFKVLFKLVTPHLKSSEISRLLDFMVEKCYGSPIPIDLDTFAIVIDHAPAACEEWLLSIDNQILAPLPIYFVLYKREMSEALREYFSENWYHFCYDSMRVLDFLIAESGFLELFPYINSQDSDELAQFVNLFQTILSCFEPSMEEQGVDLQLYVVSKGLYSLMEGMLVFSPFSYQDTDVVEHVIIKAVDSYAIAWTPMMLIKTYRDLDNSDLYNLIDRINGSSKSAKFNLNKVLGHFKFIDGISETFHFGIRLRADSEDQILLRSRETTFQHKETDDDHIYVYWNQPALFSDTMSSSIGDNVVHHYTTSLICHVLAKFFMIPYCSVKFRASELISVWRTVLGHINFFIHRMAVKYGKTPHLIKETPMPQLDHGTFTSFEGRWK